MGRLTNDPNIRYAGETTVASFSVAVDRKYKKDGQPSSDFPNVLAICKTAEFIEKYFHKGMKILIDGRLQTGSYEKDGVKHYTTDVIAELVEFAESKKQEEGNQVDANGFMNIPDGIDAELPFN